MSERDCTVIEFRFDADGKLWVKRPAPGSIEEQALDRMLWRARAERRGKGDFFQVHSYREMPEPYPDWECDCPSPIPGPRPPKPKGP